MNRLAEARSPREGVWIKCVFIITVLVFFLIGLSILGTTIYVEVKWNHLRQLDDSYFSNLTWTYISVGVTILVTALLLLFSSCFEQLKVVFGVAILIFTLFYISVITASSMMKPWEKISELYDDINYKSVRPGNFRYNIIQFLGELEPHLLCCNELPFDQLGSINDRNGHARNLRACGPIQARDSLKKDLSSNMSCVDKFDRTYSVLHFTYSQKKAACEQTCKQRLRSLYVSYFFSLLSLTVIATCLQMLVILHLVWGSVQELCCPGRSPTRCRITCDILGNMCACGCACVKSEPEDSLPITPMESPPPYTDPLPTVVNDLIDLSTINSPPEDAGSQLNQEDQTQL